MRWIRIVLFIVCINSAVYSFADDACVGAKTPYFAVESGDGGSLTSDNLKGKIVTLFYETKGTKERNRALKDALNALYSEQADAAKKDIMRLSVINCSGVIFPEMWKRELVKNSKKEGIIIYGDWDGKMASSYNTKDDESNIFIIDKKGIIRYRREGKVDGKEIEDIKNLLLSL